jgi:hypothetical protein
MGVEFPNYTTLISNFIQINRLQISPVGAHAKHTHHTSRFLYVIYQLTKFPELISSLVCSPLLEGAQGETNSFAVITTQRREAHTIRGQMSVIISGI